MEVVLIAIAAVLVAACGALLTLYVRSHGRLVKAEASAALLDAERSRNLALGAELREARARADRLQLELDRLSVRDDAASRLTSLLSPLKERIDIFNSSYSRGREQDAAARQQLLDGIDRMMHLNETIGREAKALVSALSSNGKTQGDWGEVILSRILEKSGMQEGVHFVCQLSRDADGRALRDESGHGLRPDVVLLLPDERKLIVDSKVSLTGYLRICNASTEAEARAARRAHVASIKRHIDELAAKNYQKAINGSADQVILFMPVEGAFLEGMRGDDSLWLYAWERRVVIASPTHIMSVLQLIGQLWRREERNKNAEEIAATAGLLYDRFAAFATDMLKVERSLDTTRKTFDDCLHRLTTGNRSVISTVQRLGKMAPGSRRPLPDRFTGEE